jgi:hypothetical protein
MTTDIITIIKLRVAIGVRSRAHRHDGRRLSRSRSVAGPRSHPEVRRGALRRRGVEWERPHTLSWRSAIADYAEWMSGKSRDRLAPGLTEASSWTTVRRVQDDIRPKRIAEPELRTDPPQFRRPDDSCLGALRQHSVGLLIELQAPCAGALSFNSKEAGGKALSPCPCNLIVPRHLGS